MMERINLAMLALLLIIASGLSYQFAETKFKEELSAREAKVSFLEKSIEEAQTVPAVEKPVTSKDDEVSDEEINCRICHESAQVKALHVPQTIIKINERDGMRRRTCVDCHGPLGPPWSANNQMTPNELLFFNESAGKNGVLQVNNIVPHGIHKGKLDSGAIRCQTCHGENTIMIIPVPDAEAGQILVCQNCKFHPEGGNYITIHIEIAGKKCETCHTGGVTTVHKAKTERLGRL